ncbi:hypothetical protein D3C71_2150320 [compost metagenome]
MLRKLRRMRVSRRKSVVMHRCGMRTRNPSPAASATLWNSEARGPRRSSSA